MTKSYAIGMLEITAVPEKKLETSKLNNTHGKIHLKHVFNRSAVLRLIHT